MIIMPGSATSATRPSGSAAGTQVCDSSPVTATLAAISSANSDVSVRPRTRGANSTTTASSTDPTPSRPPLTVASPVMNTSSPSMTIRATRVTVAMSAPARAPVTDSQVVTTASSAPNPVQAPTAHQCTAASSRKCSVRKAPRTPTASPPHMAVPATVASRLDTSTSTLPRRADVDTAAPCCASGGERSSCRPFA